MQLHPLRALLKKRDGILFVLYFHRIVAVPFLCVSCVEHCLHFRTKPFVKILNIRFLNDDDGFDFYFYCGFCFGFLHDQSDKNPLDCMFHAGSPGKALRLVNSSQTLEESDHEQED